MMLLYQLKQTVIEPEQGSAAAGLLHRPRSRLSAWYANPLSRDKAARLQVAAQREMQLRLCAGSRCFQLHVLQFICQFSDQGSVVLEYEKLQAVAQDSFERALLELVYGQLLVCRKRVGAHRHLAGGFALAAGHLASADYFKLLRQHELLTYLPLSETPSVPQELESLLEEAAVIRQLRAAECSPYGQAHLDTVG